MEIKKTDGQDKKPAEGGLKEEKKKNERRQMLDVLKDICEGIDPDAILRLLLDF